MSNGKKKGSKGELLACEVLKDWSGLDFRRVPQSGGLRGHIIDYTVGDIICTDDSMRNKVFPLSMEVKSYKKIDFSTLLPRLNPSSKKNGVVACEIDKWWEQTTRDAERGQKLPILFMRFNNMPKKLFFVVIDRKMAKSLYIPKDRLVSRKYVIFTSESLTNLDWETFFKKVMKLWKSMYG